MTRPRLQIVASTSDPITPPRRLSAANRIALVALAGIGVGLLLSWLVDHLIAGPGLGVIFR